MPFMCGSMVRSGSSLTPRFRIEVLCLIVSAPTVSVTLFENSGLPLNISHSYHYLILVHYVPFKYKYSEY